MGKELRLDMGNNLQGEWNTDTVYAKGAYVHLPLLTRNP